MSNEMKERLVRLAEAVAERRDQAAFAELFDYFAPRIKSYLQRLGMEPGQAEELTQEVMIVLWHKAGLFDPAKSSLATWLFRIARNRRIDAFRRDQVGAARSR
jgi:RNA polymerase sigma factor (sigma-70 family)